MQRPSTVRHRTSLFEEAVAIAEADFADDLALDDVARRVASSRRQLQRAFHEIGATTFREHLTAVRMEKAAEMLATRGLTVREVAHRVGYRQPAQFAKAFRRHHGASPSAFRQQARTDDRVNGAGGDRVPREGTGGNGRASFDRGPRDGSARLGARGALGAPRPSSAAA